MFSVGKLSLRVRPSVCCCERDSRSSRARNAMGARDGRSIEQSDWSPFGGIWAMHCFRKRNCPPIESPDKPASDRFTFAGQRSCNGFSNGNSNRTQSAGRLRSRNNALVHRSTRSYVVRSIRSGPVRSDFNTCGSHTSSELTSAQLEAIHRRR